MCNSTVEQIVDVPVPHVLHVVEEIRDPDKDIPQERVLRTVEQTVVSDVHVQLEVMDRYDCPGLYTFDLRDANDIEELKKSCETQLIKSRLVDGRLLGGAFVLFNGTAWFMRGSGARASHGKEAPA